MPLKAQSFQKFFVNRPVEYNNSDDNLSPSKRSNVLTFGNELSYLYCCFDDFAFFEPPYLLRILSF